MELVRQIAWHMHGRVHASTEIDDLVQIGYYGLVLAAQNYTVQEGATCQLCQPAHPRQHRGSSAKKLQSVPHHNPDAAAGQQGRA